MKVTVHLHSSLQIETPDGPQRRLEVELEKGATVMDLINHLKLTVDPGRLLLGINGEVARLGDQIADGDFVHLMLPVSGG